MSRPLSSSLLSWLRCFDAAALHCSFTLAASELHITQSAVSQQVKHLEDWLGRPLFHRTPRMLTLTREGVRLHAVVSETLQTLETTLEQLRRRPSQEEITLNCSPSFAMRWLTPRIGEFLRDHPELSLRIYGEFHALDRAQMTQRQIEAGIRFDRGGYTDVRATEFLEEWLMPVASPAFLADHPGIRAPADLPHALLLHDMSPWEGASDNEEWDHWLTGAGVTPPEKHEGQRFNLSQLAIGAAVSGQGIAMGRLSLVLDDLISGRLIDVFNLHVRSAAAYRFVTQPAARDETMLIEAWLRRESGVFRAECQEWVRAQRCTQIG
ncbi:LysR substrate-binding domain-containing protein [Caballeronia sp. LjRoot34]|uniref:LysR family transcriptional regulator n=1 Tax=Caballeronia sp. LjRoot34 TaxID=3342325 RepID=UPI003ED058B8